MTIVRILKQDNEFLSKEVMSLQEAVDGRGDFAYLMLELPTVNYLYPGSYGNLNKVIVSVDEVGKVEIDIVTDVEPLLSVMDPRKVTAEAIAYLKKHHEEEVKRQFLHRVFHNNFMILPKGEISIVRTSRNRDYVVSDGHMWEILANDQLLPVYEVPTDPVVGLAMGEHAARSSQYTYVSHAVYSEDIDFE